MGILSSSGAGVSFIDDLFARILSVLYHERYLACSPRSLCFIRPT